MDNFGEVLANVVTDRNEDLAPIAKQIRADVAAGKDLNTAITGTIYALGFGYAEAKKLESLVTSTQKTASKKKADFGLELDEPEDIAARMADVLERLINQESAEPMGGAEHGSLEDEARDLLAEFHSDPGQEPALEEAPGLAPFASRKTAGLKSTLRKLRRQLNDHPHDDISGMNELLSAIKGIEEQLDKKEKSKEERRKKREESGEPADPADAPEPDEDEAVEASLELQAADVPPPATKEAPQSDLAPAAPADMPAGPEKPLPSHEQMMGEKIAFFEAQKRVKAKLDELKAALEQVEKIPELGQPVQEHAGLLMEWMRTLEGQRMLVEQAGKKYQFKLTEAERYPKPEMLHQFEGRLVEAMQKGEEWASKALNVLRGFKSQDALWTQRQPDVKVSPTPKTHQKMPHTPLASRVRLAGMLDAVAEQFSMALEGISESLSLVDDLLAAMA